MESFYLVQGLESIKVTIFLALILDVMLEAVMTILELFSNKREYKALIC